MKKECTSSSNCEVPEIELVYKTNVKPSMRPQIRRSSEAFELFRQNWDEGKIDLQEQFKVMLLNNKGRVLGILTISTGSMAGCFADPKLIFAAALKAGAPSIILAHNHPSGDPSPSQNDQHLTTRLRQAGHLMDINVLDHLILTSERFISMADEGYM